MSLIIKSVKGDLHTFEFNSGTTFLEIKTKLATNICTEPGNIRLIFKGNFIMDTDLVSKYEIKEGDFFVYMAKKGVVVSEPSMQKVEPVQPKYDNLFELAEKQKRDMVEYKPIIVPEIYKAMLIALERNKSTIIAEIKNNSVLNMFLSKHPEVKDCYKEFTESESFLDEVIKYGGASSFINNDSQNLIEALFANMVQNQQLEGVNEENINDYIGSLASGLVPDANYVGSLASGLVPVSESNNNAHDKTDLTESEYQEVLEICEMGITYNDAKAFYLMCNKDKIATINCIFN